MQIRETATIVVFAAALALAGCVTLSPEGRNVRVIQGGDLTAVRECEPLRAFTVEQPGLLMATDGYEHTLNTLRDFTASAGGNTLLYTETGRVWPSTAHGTAYRCP